jgi:hypothetical protein
MILVEIDLECLFIDIVKFSSFEGQVSCPPSPSLFFCIIFYLSIYFESLLLKQVSFVKKKKKKYKKIKKKKKKKKKIKKIKERINNLMNSYMHK